MAAKEPKSPSCFDTCQKWSGWILICAELKRRYSDFTKNLHHGASVGHHTGSDTFERWDCRCLSRWDVLLLCVAVCETRRHAQGNRTESQLVPGVVGTSQCRCQRFQTERFLIFAISAFKGVQANEHSSLNADNSLQWAAEGPFWGSAFFLWGPNHWTRSWKSLLEVGYEAQQSNRY